MRLETKIIVGLLGGAVVGVASRVPGSVAASLSRVVVAAEPLGTIFIRLVTMVVVPDRSTRTLPIVASYRQGRPRIMRSGS